MTISGAFSGIGSLSAKSLTKHDWLIRFSNKKEFFKWALTYPKVAAQSTLSKVSLMINQMIKKSLLSFLYSWDLPIRSLLRKLWNSRCYPCKFPSLMLFEKKKSSADQNSNYKNYPNSCSSTWSTTRRCCLDTFVQWF